MLIKQFLILILCSFMISAESLSSINNSIKKSSGSSSSSSSSSSTTYKEQGGYTTDVHILGSERKFDPVRFTPVMLNAWLKLHNEAQTYDLISQLKQNGFVRADATLTDAVTSINVPLTPNKVINKKQIESYYEKKYTNQWIYSELIRVGVFDQQGFLTNTENFNDTYNASNFNIYIESLKQINFNFSNNAIAQSLRNELLRFIKQSSLSIHVTQEETTRYQSRKENFGDSFLDQIAGSLLGDLFFKDKVKTVKQKMDYSPNFNVYNLFTDITFGFANAPYGNGALGSIVYYGKAKQNQANLSFSTDADNDNLQHLDIELSFLSQLHANSFVKETVVASGPSIHFNELRESTDQLTWMGVRYNVSNFSLKATNNFSLGISNYTSSYNGNSQLGLALGYNGSYSPIRLLGVYYGVETNFGFDLFNSEDSTTWAINQFNLGLQSAFDVVHVRFGYEWLTGQNGTQLFEGAVFNIGYYF